tara:strand:+ start:378 stop:623 length:246 start_codon:yes stop_codon:yes gene_type:complete
MIEENIQRQPIQPRRQEQTERVPDKKLAIIKFVPVEFNYDNFKSGENEVNDTLGRGYVVIDSYKTESGLVMVMGLYRSGAV